MTGATRVAPPSTGSYGGGINPLPNSGTPNYGGASTYGPTSGGLPPNGIAPMSFRGAPSSGVAPIGSGIPAAGQGYDPANQPSYNAPTIQRPRPGSGAMPVIDLTSAPPPPGYQPAYDVAPVQFRNPAGFNNAAGFSPNETFRDPRQLENTQQFVNAGPPPTRQQPLQVQSASQQQTFAADQSNRSINTLRSDDRWDSNAPVIRRTGQQVQGSDFGNDDQWAVSSPNTPRQNPSQGFASDNALRTAANQPSLSNGNGSLQWQTPRR